MRKKKQRHVSHERWLVSYADFITLLFAFFVVMFATTQSDRHKEAQLAASIKVAFQQMGLFDVRSQLATGDDARKTGASAPTPDLAQPLAVTPQSLLMVKRQIEAAAQGEIDSGVIGIHEIPNGLVISLQEAGFFDSGVADIRPSALTVLNRIAAVLPRCVLRVEGHTDNIPIHTAQFASNWELSSARASSIARLLLVHPNVHAEDMSVAGYAEFHPATNNDTAEGRARNRRVDIVLLTKPVE
jgi:chemotaxis protein MotB